MHKHAVAIAVELDGNQVDVRAIVVKTDLVGDVDHGHVGVGVLVLILDVDLERHVKASVGIAAVNAKERRFIEDVRRIGDLEDEAMLGVAVVVVPLRPVIREPADGQEILTRPEVVRLARIGVPVRELVRRRCIAIRKCRTVLGARHPLPLVFGRRIAAAEPGASGIEAGIEDVVGDEVVFIRAGDGRQMAAHRLGRGVRLRPGEIAIHMLVEMAVVRILHEAERQQIGLVVDRQNLLDCQLGVFGIALIRQGDAEGDVAVFPAHAAFDDRVTGTEQIDFVIVELVVHVGDGQVRLEAFAGAKRIAVIVLQLQAEVVGRLDHRIRRRRDVDVEQVRQGRIGGRLGRRHHHAERIRPVGA